MTRRLTQVELAFEPERINVRLRFGRPVRDRAIDRRRRVALFAPYSVFALLRWEANAYGTTLSQLTILRTVAPGEPCATAPLIRPGGDVLLFVNGWRKVECALAAIDVVDQAGIDPIDAAPDYWRYLHNRLSVNAPPRAYSRDQHHAWLRRRTLLS